MIKKISLYCVVNQNEGTIVSDMDGEKVMMSVRNGKYYNLGRMGGEIWELMKSPVEVERVVSVLMSQYDVAQNDCENQVLSFLEGLYKDELIQVTCTTDV
ncbi:TPA: lasso peptide biosynthesis PqqD family chaperone [Bacillus cereus]|nr:lasso peptide biosynthesis PqqD family chaperone [Bacillus cereus]